MSELEAFCVIVDFFGIRKTFIVMSFLSPIEVVGHRHEDDSVFKFFWTCLTICHFVLTLLKNLQCCVSWENIPVELNWCSINVEPCFPHDNIVGDHVCDECRTSNELSVCHRPESIL